MRVLIVEDDQKLTRILREALEREMHRVSTVATGTEGFELARTRDFEVVVLDAMLPGMDGYTVARNLREHKVGTPILMLTARDATSDLVRGFDSGADDYLTKPFFFEELFARLRALERRPVAATSLVLEMADLRIDPRTHEVTRAGKPIALTPTEFRILEFMLRNPNSVLSREAIIGTVWGHEETVFNNTLDVFVKQLRAKVDEGHPAKLIHTVRGVGYKLLEAQA